MEIKKMGIHRKINIKKTGYGLMGLVLCLLLGCLTALPKKIVRQSDPSITFESLVRDAKRFRGKIVILGGTIVSLRNKRRGSELAILQSPLNRRGMPDAEEKPGGIFLVRHNKPLDRSLFRKGQKITLAAKVIGSKIRKKNKDRYSYPLLLLKEYKLWPENQGVSGESFNLGVGDIGNYGY